MSPEDGCVSEEHCTMQWWLSDTGFTKRQWAMRQHDESNERGYAEIIAIDRMPFDRKVCTLSDRATPSCSIEGD